MKPLSMKESGDEQSKGFRLETKGYVIFRWMEFSSNQDVLWVVGKINNFNIFAKGGHCEFETIYTGNRPFDFIKDQKLLE